MKYFIIFISYIISPKFCFHCTHFIPDETGNQFGRCKFFPVKITDSSFLVTGDKKEDNKYHYCDTSRKYDHMCGEYAKHYFPKKSEIEIEIEPTGSGKGGGWDDDFIGIIPS